MDTDGQAEKTRRLASGVIGNRKSHNKLRAQIVGADESAASGAFLQASRLQKEERSEYEGN